MNVYLSPWSAAVPLVLLCFYISFSDAGCDKFAAERDTSVEVNNVCYYGMKNDLVWTAAETLCMSEGARLPIYQSLARQQGVDNVIDGTFGRHWMGMKKIGTDWFWWYSGQTFPMVTDRFTSGKFSGVYACSKNGDEYEGFGAADDNKVVCEDIGGAPPTVAVPTTTTPTTTPSTTPTTTPTTTPSATPSTTPTTTPTTTPSTTPSTTPTTTPTTTPSTTPSTTPTTTPTTTPSTTPSTMPTTAPSTTTTSTTTPSTTPTTTPTSTTPSTSPTTTPTTTPTTSPTTTPTTTPPSSPAICSRTVSSTSSIVSGTFQQRAALTRVSLVATLQTSRNLECAFKCLRDASCCGFIYNVGTKECNLFESILSGGDYACTSSNNCFTSV